MLSKKQIKFIRSLENKKQRSKTGLFLAEGNKLVADLLTCFTCELLVAKPFWITMQGNINATKLIKAKEEDIQKISLLKHPQDVLAVFRQPTLSLSKKNLQNELSLVLDGIQDPGNLGTIIRLADWFGISNVICSPDTADIYNPKTIQATMGAIVHVNVFYEPLPKLLDELNDVPIYGAFLDGKTIHEEKLTSTGLIVMGNEGNGIRHEVEQRIKHHLYIPNFPQGKESTDSLNVAVAAAIICTEFRRQQVYRFQMTNSSI